MNSLTFGRYSPYHTFTHKLDPRNKILLLILLVASIFLKYTIYSTALIISGLIFIFLIFLMIISKVRITSLLKSLLSMWFLILFLLIIYILIPNSNYDESHLLFTLWKIKVYWDSFYQCGYIILRIIMMLGLTMILTSTTKPMDLTYGLEWYMTPLKLVKFPAHIIAMILSIALRFIPTLLDETNRIMKAQASRGVDFSRGGPAKRFKAVTSLIIPLLFSAFQRSDELADAMEIRGYDPNAKRSRYHKLTFTWRDLIAFIIGAGIFALILTFMIIDKNSDTKIDLIKLIFNVEIGW